MSDLLTPPSAPSGAEPEGADPAPAPSDSSRSKGSTSLIARRSVRARLGRTIAIVLAVMAGVSFVSGSFVLADSLGQSFDKLIQELVDDLDLQVRAAEAFESDDFGGGVVPIPLDLVNVVEAVDGVAIVEPDLEGAMQIIGDDGEPIAAAGGPVLGVVWSGPDGLTGTTLKEGRAPSGLDELAIDKATADREGFGVGDTITYVTDTGTWEGELVGTIGTSDSDSFLGASVLALDIPSGLERYGADRFIETINIGVADGVDPETVRAALRSALPDDVE
ncbi:MAG: ABC transporter permease, partial [Actinomycetota bacterium]